MPTGLGDEQLWLCPSLDNVTPFNDLSSQGNNGTAQGGLSTVADTASGGAYCYDFDGTDDFIQLPTTAMDYGSGNWTISFWLSSTQTTGGPLFNNYSGGGATGKYVLLNLNNDGGGGSGTGEVVGTIDDGVTKADFPTYTDTYNDGTWRYFTAIRDNVAGTVSLYEGGSSTPVSQITGTATYGDLSGSQATRIGSWTSLVSRSTLDGRMDDIRYYNRVLTQSEITHLASQRGVLGAPAAGGGATLITSTSKGGATTNAIDTTGADMICVNVATYNKLGLSITDSESNTWVALSVDINSTQRNGMFYCLNPTTSASHTFTYSEPVSYPTVAVMAFSGVSAFDSEATSTQSGASFNILSGQVTPSADGCLVIAAGSFEGGTISSVGSGFTLQEVGPYSAGQYVGSMFAYLNQSVASAVNPEFIGSTSSLKSASTAVFTTATTTTQYNAFSTHAFRQLFQTRIR